MPLDPASPVPAAQLVAERWSPTELTPRVVTVETSADVSPALHRQVAAAYPGLEVAFRRVEHVELQCRQLVAYTADLARHMAHDFSDRFPTFAARSGIAGWQRWLALVGVVAAVVAAVVAPRLLFLLLVGFTALVTLTSAVASAAGASRPTGRARRAWRRSPVARTSEPLRDAELPTYTVLVPAYHEEAVIGGLVESLAMMDYPRDKLEVLILVERRDLATQEAILAANPEPCVRIVELPPGAPQTKPRSCNAGLLLASGELLVIYDAEDRPEPDQLRKAAAAFATGDADLACVQAKLLVHNADENFITRQFALEYAMRYELTVPGLARMNLPIPLGGSSNHFRTTQLRRAGGWDAWNVTEDADLGMRLQAMGYHVGVVDSITWSESVENLGAWVRQRTRWLKGFMLTALVHSRRPADTLRTFRPRGLVTLGAIVGGTPAHYLAQSLAFLLWATGFRGITETEVPGTTGISLALLVVGLTATLALQTVAARRSGASRLAVFSPLLPAYWVMQWVAAWRAVVQLVRSPFQWEKTPHAGVVPVPAAAAPSAVALAA